MRIEREDGATIGPVRATLTPAEAHELASALIDYFDDAAQGAADPGWHHHVGESSTELTVAIEPDPS